MAVDEIIKKAREMGVSEEEISRFMELEAEAKKYGFEGDYSSLNVKIDKKKQAEIEAGASEEAVFPDDETECECEECHCEDGDCCCHHHQN